MGAPLYTIPELNRLVGSRRMSPDTAGVYAADRSFSGLCLNCDSPRDRNREDDLCSVCGGAADEDGE